MYFIILVICLLEGVCISIAACGHICVYLRTHVHVGLVSGYSIAAMYACLNSLQQTQTGKPNSSLVLRVPVFTTTN